MRNKRKEKGLYIYLLLKLAVAFCTLLAMQVMFGLSNTRIFHIAGFGEWMGILWGNIIFGMATVGAFLLPYFVLRLVPTGWRWKRPYHIVCETLYIVAMLLVIIPRGCNAAYYQYTYRLLSDEIFSYLGIGGQMGSLVPLFAVDYWYAWIIPLGIAVLFLLVNSRYRLAPRNSYSRHLGNDLAGTAIGLLVLWFMLWGGFGHMLRTTDAAHYCQPKNTALVNNDAYNILRTLLAPDLKEADYLSPDEASVFNPVFTSLPARPADTAASPRRNVVLIIVESLGQEFMGCYNQQQGADNRTPFLDSLARHSTLYDGRSNGKKSIEGITAFTTSIPNLMSIPLTNSAYADDDMEGIPTVLKRHGYRCAFFHGSYNGEMSFDKTCAKLGFDDYLGKNEYEASPMARPGDYDGVWGIYDEPFLQFTAATVGTFREPFFAEVFTVTSHHPFPIPAEHKGRFVEGRHPILKCVEYTDYALRRFFDEAKRQPWYNNTLFIITGDHSGHGLTPEYNDYDGWYRIPMIIFDPQHPQAVRHDRIMQQTDLFPTLVDWLGLRGETLNTFGTSAVQQPRIGWQVYYGNDFYCMVSNNADDPSQHDITLIAGDREQGRPEDIRFLKAFIQQYNDRIINNKLTSK